MFLILWKTRLSMYFVYGLILILGTGSLYLTCTSRVNRGNSRQPRVISDMKVELQLLCFCITYCTVNRGDFEHWGDFEHFRKTNFVFS